MKHNKSTYDLQKIYRLSLSTLTTLWETEEGDLSDGVQVLQRQEGM